ncbi:MAG: hypothetical protein QF793_00705 [Candidatus Peribacteraceae bacterium]|nr:hypothetical protein [Candidatus Peribacteraceae bacterium]
MRIILVTALLAIFASAHTVEAATFFDHVRYTQFSLQPYNYQFRYSQPNYYQPPSIDYRSSRNDYRCLYRNAQGECMIEQYYDPSNVRQNNFPYVPTYDRNYLRNERRYSNRYDDDDDYYNWRPLDDCDFYDDDCDDDDYDDFYDDDDYFDRFFDDDDDDDDDD